MDVVVFGAGSLGSLIGGLLARKHEVTLVGSEEHMRSVRRNGLRVVGEYSFTTQVNAETTLPEASFDVAVVSVKSYDTGRAASALSDAEVDVVLSVQNGMGNEERLTESVSSPVLAGITTFGALRPEPGVVRCTGRGRVTIGSLGDDVSVAESVGQAFTVAGVPTEVTRDIRVRLWEKLAVNAGINPTTASVRGQNKVLVEDGLEWVAREAMRETVRVAQSAGVDLTVDAASTTLSEVIERTGENYSSMAQDVLAGHRTEIDAINGYVVERAHDPVPINTTLTGLVRGWEQSVGLR